MSAFRTNPLFKELTNGSEPLYTMDVGIAPANISLGPHIDHRTDGDEFQVYLSCDSAFLTLDQAEEVVRMLSKITLELRQKQDA